jgi:UDP:flavonoid glycosyltransferase YjiC (YdhE family)
MVLGELNRIRSGLSLSPVDSLWQAWQRHSVLNASIPELDPTGTAGFGPESWVGPIFEDVQPSEWDGGDSDDRPLVLVSFSSGVAWDQTSRIQRTIDGLAQGDLRVLVTAGATDPKLLDVPAASITVVPYAPHGAILPLASAVVTHAGHGTLSAALAHGLPIVAIPNNAADQPVLAAQTERLGAGIHLADDVATPSAIAAAVRAVLDDPRYTAKARGLGDRIRSHREQPLSAVTGMLVHPAGQDRRR